MTDGVCEHVIDVAIRMQIACVFVCVCVYSTSVTVAEVNKSGVTVTEESVIMIPASPWACVRIKKHTNFELRCLSSQTCCLFTDTSSLHCKSYAGKHNIFMFLACDRSFWPMLHYLLSCSSESAGEMWRLPRMC